MSWRVCCVANCNNKTHNKNLKFYSFPIAKHKLLQRREWITALNKNWYRNYGEVWSPKKHDLICSEHFIGGRKSDVLTSPSYSPSIFPSSTSSSQGDQKLERALKDKMKFMEDFNPERSDRERRKLTKKILSHTRATERAATIYNEMGIHVPSGKNMCDCFSHNCPGCFVPCPKCRSTRCGVDCRVNRKWSYDMYHIEGLDLRRVNKLKEFEKSRTDMDLS